MLLKVKLLTIIPIGLFSFRVKVRVVVMGPVEARKMTRIKRRSMSHQYLHE